ncbi:hypothetical protein AB0F77_13825 [Streptomyces sp. NPDC026672]|uniref:hypothetical protein n=1 Tax=unclassified Streptomyces TaxID=2593676 RepID=UPI0033C4AD75
MQKPPLGSWAVDTLTGKLGIVMGHEGPYVQLRPYGGGLEWDARPEAVREATPDEHPADHPDTDTGADTGAPDRSDAR